MKYDRLIEVCEYCDASYHPMPRWTNAAGSVIFVHNFIFDFENETHPITIDETCEKIAQAAGYEKRMDLTPRR